MTASRKLDPAARYQTSHEWARPEGDDIYICGISDFAQSELMDVVYVDLDSAEVGKTLKRGEVFGAVESVKSANDLYMPMSGEIIAVNEDLDPTPEMVNEDCYGSGWMIKFRATNPNEWDELLEPSVYNDSLPEPQ